ncbi:MAG: tetraprenyl-beta-curcumene synthase family protein [Firmicutes bacterium]|nr:tetraprenyl-beta-curcumene synthase family protein [Bacillota bacterium]
MPVRWLLRIRGDRTREPWPAGDRSSAPGRWGLPGGPEPRLPGGRIGLMLAIHRQCRPLALREVAAWRRRAEGIPDPALRRQALLSLRYKCFHCEGGAAYAAGTGRVPDLTRVICAFQILVDYLDNLSDRCGVQSPATLVRLHRAVADALTPGGQPPGGYYPGGLPDPDGGYLTDLVYACRQSLARLPGYRGEVERTALRLGGLYATLQVLKHLEVPVRQERLVRWLEPLCRRYPELHWWELAAACGSTLGIFALLRAAALGHPAPAAVDGLYRAYFPWVGALHILLDYYIDQEEDRQGGDLNFASYYPDRTTALGRLGWIARRAREQVLPLDPEGLHRLILAGLPGLYLSDPKVAAHRRLPETRRLLRQGGLPGLAAYLYCTLCPPVR